MEKTHERLIRFDWAIKRLLRHKADHTILNGFLSSLLGREIRIVRILESEGNKQSADDKFNRVDILAENENKEKILIEVQNDSEDSFFHRMSYGTSKLVTEYIKEGDKYGVIPKIYSINIVYFNIGAGDDYVYHGTTQFIGLHDGKPLGLTGRLKKKYDIKAIDEIFPQYYLLKADDFDRWSQVPLDQWMYFLSTSTIPENATAPGLQEAREQLRVDSLDEEARRAYYNHLDSIRTARSLLETAYDKGMYKGEEIGIKKGREIGREEGIEEGKEIGRVEGREEGDMERLRKNVRSMRENGFDDESIARIFNEDINLINSL